MSDAGHAFGQPQWLQRLRVRDDKGPEAAPAMATPWAWRPSRMREALGAAVPYITVVLLTAVGPTLALVTVTRVGRDV